MGKRNRTGFVTLPAESGKLKEVLELARQWGADAIRDSDGTTLSTEYLNLDYEIYSTICLVRADQEFANANRDQLAQKYLMSDPVTATCNSVSIDLLKGFFRRKYIIDINHDPKQWWEVIDRTTGDVVDSSNWDFNAKTGSVTVSNAKEFHVYTVNFLIYQIWDSVSMYNHLSNNWDIEPIKSVDPYLTKTRKHLMKFFDNWLAEHPHTDVVRLTTLAYNFTLDSDETGKDRYRDWLGYTDCISPAILEDFAKEKGYKLSPEDIVDNGYYNATCRIPSQKYLDWMDFIQKFVVEWGRQLVEKCHKAGKKTAIFWGDHWIGTEPYSKRYQDMKIDINIGACEDGVALRRLADAPGPQTKEIRLYPYFFPDVFAPGGDPLSESMSNWVKIRRAMLRNCVDRIGYGGYTGLALQFPKFVEHVTEICDEFRTIKTNSQLTKPYTADIKVYVLNAWGKLRSWLNNVTPDEKFNSARPDVTTIAGSNLLECLSGLPVDVEFISFSDIEKNGIPKDASVIINDGVAETSWSGGHWWANEKVITDIRKWIHNGGGFVGAVEPTAHEHNGKFFQLADVMGIQKETGQTMGGLAVETTNNDNHFITDGLKGDFQAGLGKSFVYASRPDTNILQTDANGHIHLASNTFGNGRSVFISALPYSLANARLLHRTLFWARQKEADLQRCYSDNANTDCAVYPETGFAVIVNNVDENQQTTFYDMQGDATDLTLRPYESRWLQI
ncbi:MAG: 1,3-beta-galactosyl-N-acetylhexosamine phosphorylase [Proteobacteria bacterium]|nr:1,3-beta-galactosyl-N-acetylhexosamine phosphorylase [Pseudomonadota bacterium]